MKHQIKHRFTESVLFECDLPDDTLSRLVIRHALEKATAAGAYLDGANLDGANLDGANLAGANLDGANLARALLVGERPIFQIGPIGSRCTYFTAYLTSEGVKLRAGCFFGTVDEFTAKLSQEHGDNIYAKEYRAALNLIHHHAELWTQPTP
jgi:uncharacterized protein YjbI with pentapeptide repeats